MRSRVCPVDGDQCWCDEGRPCPFAVPSSTVDLARLAQLDRLAELGEELDPSDGAEERERLGVDARATLGDGDEDLGGSWGAEVEAEAAELGLWRTLEALPAAELAELQDAQAEAEAEHLAELGALQDAQAADLRLGSSRSLCRLDLPNTSPPARCELLPGHLGGCQLLPVPRSRAQLLAMRPGELDRGPCGETNAAGEVCLKDYRHPDPCVFE